MSHSVIATVVGPASGADRKFTFSMDQDPAQVPSDEVVEAFMAYLDSVDELPHSAAYELNSAMRNREHKVIMALGHLNLGNEVLPFVTMLDYSGAESA